MSRIVYRAIVFLLAFILFLVVAAMVVSGWIGWEAEKTLHAYRLVLDVLIEYVETEGEWPTGWTDMEAVKPPGEYGLWRWPDDIDEVRKRITVEFDLRGKDLTVMTADSFDLVRQSDPNYGPYAYGAIDRLLELLTEGG